MPRLKAFILATLLSFFGIFSVGGCGQGGLAHPENTFLTGNDLIQMTDQMAQSIVADPLIAQASAQHPMVIVIQPAKNETDSIIPDNQKRLFVHRVRVLLAQNPTLRQRFTWVLNQGQYRALQTEGFSEAQLGPMEDRLQPQYALTATLFSDTHVDSTHRSDFYLCAYRLYDIQTGATLWENKYETKKFSEKGLLD